MSQKHKMIERAEADRLAYSNFQRDLKRAEFELLADTADKPAVRNQLKTNKCQLVHIQKDEAFRKLDAASNGALSKRILRALMLKSGCRDLVETSDLTKAVAVWKILVVPNGTHQGQHILRRVV